METGGDEKGTRRNEGEEERSDEEEDEEIQGGDPVVEDSDPLTTEEATIQRLRAKVQRLRKRNREEREEWEKQQREWKEADEKWEREKQEREKAEAEARLDAARANGTYYATIEDVWGTATSAFSNASYFEDLRRSRAPNVVSPNGVNYYQATLAKAKESATHFVPPVSTPTFGSSRCTFHNTVVIWPVNVFGAPREITMHRAHLVPHSAEAATLYFDAAIWALGLQEATADEETKRTVPFDWDTVQRAIHGTTDPESHPVPDTGIKHSVPNMICFQHQDDFFDRYPCLLIIPILTLDEVKTWNGGGYDALVMAGEYSKNEGSRIPATFSEVCRGVGMTDNGKEARPEQMDAGRELLTCVLRGMAYSLAHRSPERDRHLTEDQKKDMNKYRSKFPANESALLVPSANPSPPHNPCRVRVVEFRGVADPVDEETEKKHLAPDPLLLTARAAINWSRRQDQPLLARDKTQEDIFDKDELYQLAMEEYLNKVDQALRPPDDDPEEFARRLGRATTATANETECE